MHSLHFSLLVTGKSLTFSNATLQFCREMVSSGLYQVQRLHPLMGQKGLGILFALIFMALEEN